MAEQKSRSARGVRKRAGAAGERTRRGAGKVMDEAGSRAGDTAKGVADAPSEVADQVQGNNKRSDRRGQEPQTMREELGSIVRETAIEVLGPVMRTATKSAAKYAVRKAPEMIVERLLPKARELQSSIEDAGGAGAYARGAFGSGSEGGGLSRLKQLGRGDEDSAKASERVPEQESVDVAAPLETVYEQFTQLDDFAQLLSDGDIVEEQENERIVWTKDDEDATAVATFHRLDDRLTRVMVSYDQQPQNLAGKALSALHTSKRGLRSDLARFKALVEMNELGGDDGGAARSEQGRGAPRGRRGASREDRRASREEESPEEEPEDEEYDDEEPYDVEETDEPEAESGEILDAESEDIPEDESDETPEAESEYEPDEVPEPEPKRRPARTRAPRRRAPAQGSKPSRARRSR